MKLLRRHLRRMTGKTAPFRAEPALEDVYRHLFARELERLGEPDIFYPTGGAANYSLLYLVARIACDLRPRAVLDVGAGQSTLLWNMLRRHGLVGEVVTLEHDADWGARIGAQVDHEVLVTPLRAIRVGAVQTSGYDWKTALGRAPFDVVVCDGPIGTPRFSRYGVLSALGRDTPPDFTLVLDDVERAGEQDTVGAIHDCLKRLGRSYDTGIVRAAKSQMIFATGEHKQICYV